MLIFFVNADIDNLTKIRRKRKGVAILWPVLALGSAVSKAMQDLFGKKAVAQTDKLVIGCGFRFVISVIMSLILILIVGFPKNIGNDFWVALVVGGTINAVVTILNLTALQKAELSLAAPMLAFTPAFMLITSPIMLGEYPRPLGVIGIVLIVVGAYILNVRVIEKGVFEPIKALWRERGVRYMLGVSFLWSITSNYDKIAVTAASPIYWSLVENFYIASLLLVFVLRNSSMSKTNKNLKQIFAIGVFTAAEQCFQFYALTMTMAANVIAIKRTSLVFSTLFGKIFFHEKIFSRLPGAIVMAIGVAVIVLLK